jgi:hypothetical protein
MDDPGCLGVTSNKDFVELFLGKLIAGIFAERININLPKLLAPAFNNLAEGTFACPISKKAFIILEFDVIAVDIDRRQAQGAMRSHRWYRA